MRRHYKANQPVREVSDKGAAADSAAPRSGPCITQFSSALLLHSEK